MNTFTRSTLTMIFALVLWATHQQASAQSILDPNDPVITYDPNAPAGSATNPNMPANANAIAKWIRTVRLSWNTNEWKAYILHTIPFRLKFPPDYNPTANDGKKYPILVFWHGDGEKGPATDNEFQLANGGPVFTSAVDNGQFDGFILAFQSPGNGWSNPFFDLAVQVINYMVANNKVDPYRVIANGLSGGGYGTWGMLDEYPNYVAAALPMSGITLGDAQSSNINITKFTPMWDFQGGLDTGPDPNTAQTVINAIAAAGGNMTYTLFPNLGHGTWDASWAEPDFWPFCNRAYLSNPWTLFGQTAFCPGQAINVTIGVAPGLDAYQWRKDGVALSATTNSITATATGTYDCRVERGGIWSDWSHTPVVISIKQPTITPPITVSGLMSKVIPSLANPGVNLKVPSGYVSYAWEKVGDTTTIGHDSVLYVTKPGNYIVQVTELHGCSSNFSPAFTVIDSAGGNKPDAASSVTATTLSQTSIELDWSQNPTPAHNETGFEVYQATSPTGPYTLAAITNADVTTQVLTGLTPKTKYYYIVRAVDGTGAGALSTQVVGTTSADVQAPTVPSTLKVVGSTNTSVSLSWGASTDNIAVTQYLVYVNGVKSFTVPPTQTSFTVNSLTKGQNYLFTVQATDAANNLSGMSNQVNSVAHLIGLSYNYYNNLSTSQSVVPNFTTMTPTSTGFMNNVSLASAPDAVQYGYLWQGFIHIPVTGTYTFQTSSDDGSNLYLGTLGSSASPYNPTGTPTVANDGLHGTNNANSAALNLTAGTYPIAITYFQQGGGVAMTVQWQTPSSGGNFVSIPDSVFADNLTAPGAAPAVPTVITATPVSYKTINVKWTDNSNNETGFEVYRATSTGGVYSLLGTTTANTTLFVDSTCQPATTYFYKVQAINQSGASGYDPNSLGGLQYGLYYPFTQNNMQTLPGLSPQVTGTINNVTLNVSTQSVNYALKFAGTINIPTTGTYTFSTASDDGSDLYVGGFDSAHLVVKNDFLQGVTTRSGTVSLTKGSYPIFVTYFQQGGGVGLTASYSGPGISNQLIPDSAFINKLSSATTLALPTSPIAPYNAAVGTVTTSSISFSWADTASGVTGFNVYRSIGDSSRYLLLTTVPANVNSYTDTALYPNQTYFYKVSATWLGGNTGYAATLIAKVKDVAPVIVKLASRNIRYGTTTVIPVSATGSGALTLSGKSLPAFASLADNGDGTGSLTLAPTVANAGTYTGVTVKAADANGGADSTVFNLNVNGNYTPVVTLVPDTTIHEADSVVINLTATDSTPSANLTFSVSNLPNNYTLTSTGNGTATLTLKPTYAAAGNYTVNVNINDGQGDSSTRTFHLTVIDKDPTVKIYARVKYANSIGAPWNSMTGPSTPNLVDANGNTTAIGVNFLQSWWMPFNGGPSTGNNSGVYPDAVLNDFWYFGYFGGPETAGVSVTGLNQSNKYNLTLYAGSNFSGETDNGTTLYTIGTQTQSLYVQNNTKNTVTFSSLSPDASGKITVNMQKAPGTPIGYLNAMVITQLYDDGTAPAAPSTLTAQNVPGKGVQLNWIDSAFNETGYQLYRSQSSTGTYTLLSTLATGAVSYLDSAVSGATTYFYSVRAVNSHGNSAYTDTASATTTDRIPTLAAIADVTLKNNATTTVAVSATDDATDHVTLTVSGLPSFASFVDNGDGTGAISIAPTAGIIGSFSGITVTATDNSDSSRSKSFNLFIVDPNVSSTYVNMTNFDNLAPAPWNNLAIAFQPGAGSALSGLKDDGNAATGITVTLTDAFDGLSLTGMRRRNGSEVYPETVERSGLYMTNTTARRITVSGLNTAKTYNFVFYNSDGTSQNSTTNFTIGAQTVSLNASYNSNKTVEINGVVPASNGTVVISCAKDASAAVGLLSALVIEAYTPGVVTTLSPADLRKLDFSPSNTVQLQWQDRATNETGYEVLRSINGGSFTHLSSLPAHATSYTNSGLTPNTAYDYVVRAINGTDTSGFSNTVRGYAYASTVYINFNGLNTGNVAPAPWNNLNWVYGLGATWSNFNDETGIPTNIGMVQPVKVDGLVSPGVNTGNNSGVFPDKVLAEGFGMFPGDTTWVVLNNLDLSKTYDITVTASLTNYPGENSTVYMVNGKTYLLNSLNNTTGTLTMFGLQPDANGSLKISFTGYPTATFGLLGAMVIKGYTPSTNPLSVPATTAVSRSAVTSLGNQLVNDAANSLESEELKAFPNPFVDNFTLTVPAHNGDNVQVVVMDLSGRAVLQQRFENLLEGTNVVRIQPSMILPRGMYIVRVLYGNKTMQKTIKLIKQ